MPNDVRPARRAEDPLEALARLEKIARHGLTGILGGRSASGRTALLRIAEDAADVRRHHAEDRERISHE